jgi:hypothetical protein
LTEIGSIVALNQSHDQAEVSGGDAETGGAYMFHALPFARRARPKVTAIAMTTQPTLKDRINQLLEESLDSKHISAIQGIIEESKIIT